MKFGLTCDANWDSGLNDSLNNFSRIGFRKFFEERNYGSSMEEGIFVVFMCRNPEYNFKQRIRFSKKEQVLYIDIMLDYNQFKQIEQSEREKIMAYKLISEVPPIIAKYKFPDFDLQKFEADLRSWLEEHKLL